ncbi:hypothetical protein M3Y95_00412400 [Aphelenchoides besseyi]|nr:hypothetical protein M3Y95_00412400 [Aphelenchoides besseyi]
MKFWMPIFCAIVVFAFEYAGAFGNNECIKDKDSGHNFEFSSCQTAEIKIKWKTNEMLFLGYKAVDKNGGDNFTIFFDDKAIDFHTKIDQTKWEFKVGETSVTCNNNTAYCGIVIQSNGAVGPFVYSATPINLNVELHEDVGWFHAKIRVVVASILQNNEIIVGVADGETGVLEDVEPTTTSSTTPEPTTIEPTTIEPTTIESSTLKELVNLTGDAFQSAGCVVVSVHVIVGCIAIFFLGFL